jgi:hypothetical protein
LFDLLRDWPLDTMNLLAIALLLALGTASLWRAWKRSRSPGSQTARRENPRQTLFVLAGVAALIGILAALTTRQMSLAQLGATPLLPALSMALAGIAGALLVSRSRSANIGAGANALAAIILALPTLQASGLLTRRAHLIRTHATAVEIGRISLPLNTMSVALSPDGRRMLTRRYENDRAGGFFHYTARSLDGAPRELDALQAEFTDSDHLLSLRRTGDTLSLQLERADSSSVLWTSKLSAAFAARLSVSPSDRTWSVIVEKTVIAETEGDDSVVVFSGVVDSPSVSTRHLASTRSVVLNGEGLVAIGSRLIMPAYDLGNWRPGSLALAALMMPKTNVWEITPTGRRQIGDFDGFPQCGAADRGVAACVVRQRSRSELWTLADTGKPVFVGTLPLAEVILVSIGPGARVTAASRNNTVFVVDAAAGRLTEVSVPADSAGAVVVAQSAPGIVATLRRGIATTTLVLYRVP